MFRASTHEFLRKVRNLFSWHRDSILDTLVVVDTTNDGEGIEPSIGTILADPKQPAHHPEVIPEGSS